MVDGDAMTIPQLIDQLKKIVPSDKFHWEVFPLQGQYIQGQIAK
jgi:hypothetical protein